ncbi:MAG TPA: hypothetical protein VFA74_11380 [Terriglobales bacterium]|nr:hypothetical protein [Terriglobales bacterium]
MTQKDFEKMLTAVAATLTREVRRNATLRTPSVFEDRARALLRELSAPRGIKVDPEAHAQVFPDIPVGEFGVEVKVNSSDSWRSVANSVFEGTRHENVKHVYVLFGKMGGTPEVRWGRYEDSVMHVRTSHVPRFEVEIGTGKPLFVKFGLTYDEFCELPDEGKMRLIRQYARGRLKEGEHLWWLEEKPEKEQEHSLDLQVRLFMNLEQGEKRRLRAEAALLCPQIVKPSRAKKKYEDAAMYLLTYRGVLCPQARDLFSAGSVALRSDATRGGNYLQRALNDIEPEMRSAAKQLEDALFVEYWGEAVPPESRIKEWLKRADRYARGTWVPSKELFKQ